MSERAVLRFPLRGEWIAINTPAERVPSHGTDYFGQRYAYDFVRKENDRFHRNTLLRELWGRVPVSDYFAWDAPVHSAAAGAVVAIGEGWLDRSRINALVELVRVNGPGAAPQGRDYRPLAGNYVMVEGDAGVALYAHLRNGSIVVKPGQRVNEGDVLGAVGNSGNTTMPHLHFHLMDGTDPLRAAGLLCSFRGYERFVNGAWASVEDGMPNAWERIRAR